ncbi:MAG: DUF4838 domain-containing protein [Clostridia bacterium]|nr:DUF4838 domain-containing protein [Clostridia bacterium]
MRITQSTKIYATCDSLYAAKEMSVFLGKVFSSDPLLITDNKEDACIILGEADENFLLPKNDGFCILCDGRRLQIYGSCVRGTLYGVYDFLERFAGIRWFTPDVTKIVHMDSIYIGELRKIDEPAFLYREPDFLDAARDPDFAARLRVISRRQTEKHGGFLRYANPHVHTMNYYCPPKKYYDEHPEYFALVNGERLKEGGQPCLTNPEVLKIVTEAVRENLRNDPTANILSISQNDCDGWCECENCKAIDEEEGSHAGTLIRFVNSVAEALEGEFPNVLFSTLAYRYSRTPTLKTKPRDNVTVRLCTIEECFMHALDECEVLAWPFCNMHNSEHTMYEEIESWGKISKNVFMWDYVVNFANYIMPYPNYKAIVNNMKIFAANGVKGMFSQGNRQSLGGDFAPLKVYMLSKLMWDPNCDIITIANEFIEYVYGKASKYISEYLQMIYDHVQDNDIHIGIYEMPSKLRLTDELILKADNLFDEAEKAADSEHSKKYVRLARLSVKYLHLWNADNGEEIKEQCSEFLKEIDELGVTHISQFPTLDISRGNLENGFGPFKSQKDYWARIGGIVTKDGCK